MVVILQRSVSSPFKQEPSNAESVFGFVELWSIQDDVSMQGPEQLSGAPSVEVQRRQRVAPSARQHQEVFA